MLKDRKLPNNVSNANELVDFLQEIFAQTATTAAPLLECALLVSTQANDLTTQKVCAENVINSRKTMIDTGTVLKPTLLRYKIASNSKNNNTMKSEKLTS